MWQSTIWRGWWEWFWKISWQVLFRYIQPRKSSSGENILFWIRRKASSMEWFQVAVHQIGIQLWLLGTGAATVGLKEKVHLKQVVSVTLSFILHSNFDYGIEVILWSWICYMLNLTQVISFYLCNIWIWLNISLLHKIKVKFKWNYVFRYNQYPKIICSHTMFPSLELFNTLNIYLQSSELFFWLRNLKFILHLPCMFYHHHSLYQPHIFPVEAFLNI